jgi:hypothetical protein
LGDRSVYSNGGRGFPVFNHHGPGSHTAAARRQKQVFVPATGLVGVAVFADDQFEGACWLELA